MSAAKICGLCRPEDAALAAAAGAQYAGVILAPGRRRTQVPGAARRILEAAGPLVKVGVFVDPAEAEVLEAVTSLGLDVVQLHGNEPPELVTALRAAGAPKIWKALAVSDTETLRRDVARFGQLVDGLLLDGGAGGSGHSFDWEAAAWVRAALPSHCLLIVAGGLEPTKVAEAVRTVRADVADVSSGVEAAPGEKSEAAVRAFVAAAGALPERERDAR